MKTGELLDKGRWGALTVAHLAAVVLFSASACHAQHASCKEVADAEVLLMRTPHHVVSTDVHKGRSTVTEGISVPRGVFWASNGVWRKAPGSMQEFARDSMDSIRELRDCHRIGDKAADGQPAPKYAFHSHASGGDDAAWVAKVAGYCSNRRPSSGTGRFPAGTPTATSRRLRMCVDFTCNRIGAKQ